MITAFLISHLLFFPSPIYRDPSLPQEIAITQWGEAWIGTAHNYRAGGSFYEADTVRVLIDNVWVEYQVIESGVYLCDVVTPNCNDAVFMAMYQKELTAPLEKADAVAGKAPQSLLLGMYSADLAYATVHKDGQRAMATMQAIEKLGGKLELTNSFDRALLDRFKTNLGSEDSLLQFSGVAFRSADKYLKQNQRHDVSAMVLAGGWVESLYLTVSDPAAAKDQTLVNRIGEQKHTLSALVELMRASDTENAASDITKALQELQGLFNGVEHNYTFQEPVTDAAKKTTFINSTSSVTIPADQLTAIVAKVSAIRNMMLA